jgi:2,5-dihydroxypyridine 5,6-dioxygenase
MSVPGHHIQWILNAKTIDEALRKLEPFRLDGVVQKIEGGRDAKNLERMWREQNDPNVYNIAQFAMGMNPLSHEVTGGIVHDHGVYGSVHFGIGTSSNLGGKVKATGHIDGILLDAQVWLDDQLLLSERNYFLDGSGVRQSL